MSLVFLFGLVFSLGLAAGLCGLALILFLCCFGALDFLRALPGWLVLSLSLVGLFVVSTWLALRVTPSWVPSGGPFGVAWD